MARTKEPASVVLSDPLAIRALAHPARMTMIEVLYGRGTAMTATELGDLVDLSPSAASYHLRSLERYGVVRRAGDAADRRQRPWVRAAVNLLVNPSSSGGSRAGRTAAAALVASAMERDRAGLTAAQGRRETGDASVPLDAVARYQRHSLVLTPAEAEDLMRRLDALIEPWREENRAHPPTSAGRLTLSITAVADPKAPRRD